MALGELYVDKTFGPQGKERTLKMVQAIEQAMHQDIGHLNWMSDTTKQKAYEKLSTIVNNIGYPDKWRDYSTVIVASATIMPATSCGPRRSRCSASATRSPSRPTARIGA